MSVSSVSDGLDLDIPLTFMLDVFDKFAHQEHLSLKLTQTVNIVGKFHILLAMKTFDVISLV